MYEFVQLVVGRFRRAVHCGQPMTTVLLQPMLTVGMLLFLYAGWHVRDEGSVDAGLRVAFIDTRAFRADRKHEQEAVALQAELHNAADTDRQIDRLLTGLLARSPVADRVRLGVAHNGITGVTGIALLRYDITNAVTSPGYASGPMVVNQPLSEWNGFLSVLLAGRCFFGVPADQPSPAIRARLESLGASTFLACPVTDNRNRMLGATFLTWSGRNIPPTGEVLQALMKDATSVGAQIGHALDNRGKMSPFSGPAEG